MGTSISVAKTWGALCKVAKRGADKILSGEVWYNVFYQNNRVQRVCLRFPDDRGETRYRVDLTREGAIHLMDAIKGALEAEQDDERRDQRRWAERPIAIEPFRGLTPNEADPTKSTVVTVDTETMRRIT